MTVRMPRVVHVADRLEPDVQADARVRSRPTCSAPRLQAVQVVGVFERREVAVGLAPLPRTCGSGRGSSSRLSARRAARAASPRARRGPRRSAARCRSSAVRPFSTLVRNGSGQPPGRSPSSPAMKPTTESGTSYFSGCCSKSAGVGVRRREGEREVADHLRRRRDLRRAAEDAVGRGVPVLDLLELVAEAQRDGLLAEVRSWPPGISWWYTRPVGPGRPASNGPVERARTASQYGSRSLTACEAPARCRARCGRARRRARTADGWLRRAGHRGAGGVHRVRARAARGEQGGELAAGGVVRVHVHRQVEPLAQGGDELLGGARAQQARHVLDREDVRSRRRRSARPAAGSSPGCRASRPGRAGRPCSRRDLGDRRALGEHRVDRRAASVDVVERVEDAEDVDARSPSPRGRTRRSTSVVRACSRRCCGRAAASGSAMFGKRSRMAVQPLPRVFSRGSAAPRRRWPRPSASTDSSCGRHARHVRQPRRRGRVVRTRVASSDWWASRNVVSVTGERLAGRAAAHANPAGPELRAAAAASRAARAGCRLDALGQLVGEVDGAGRRRRAGWLTVTSAEPVEQLRAAVAPTGAP